MIIVPRKIFDQMSPKALTEAEETDGQFNVIHFLKGMDKSDRLQWLKKNAAWVGTGSSRISYILNDMTVLKIAHNDRGNAQNRQEYQNTVDENGHGKYSCFSEIYDADTKDWEMIRVEMATPAVESDFKEFLSMNCAAETVAVPVSLYVSNMDPKRLFISEIVRKKIVDIVQSDALDNQKMVEDLAHSQSFTELTYRILKHKEKNASEQNIASVLQFFQNNGLKKMIPADLTFEDNWGTVWRNGINQLIIIDSGFSEDVWEKFYTS